MDVAKFEVGEINNFEVVRLIRWAYIQKVVMGLIGDTKAEWNKRKVCPISEFGACWGYKDKVKQEKSISIKWF